MVITGTFEIDLIPKTEDKIDVGRMIINKIYKGEITGKGNGQMLSKRTGIEGSAGYVAIEEFEGAVRGKEGTFALLHKGVMDKGAQSLEVIVIPDSGTGELKGISGNMNIIIEDGKHSYEFSYKL